MKLLLTSSGFTNESIVQGLKKLLDESNFKDTSLAYIPTASNIEQGDKSWLIEDLINIHNLGLKLFDIVDISALNINEIKKRTKDVDVIMIGGGNDFYLSHWLSKSGFSEVLKNYLNSKVYVGVSAGSFIMSSNLDNPIQELFEEENYFNENKGLGLVDFYIVPHYKSKHFDNLSKEKVLKISKEFNEKIYAIDDNSAVLVNGNDVKVISEGEYEIFN